jgi:hypothetical protein
MTVTTQRKLDEETARDVRDDFEERGWDNPRATWQDALRFARAYGLVTPGGLKPVNRAAAKILTVCKKHFLKGQRAALRNLPAAV